MMSKVSPKAISNLMALPRSISFIVLCAGTLAFLIFVMTQLFVANSVGSTLQGYLLGVDKTNEPTVMLMESNRTVYVTSKESSIDGQEGVKFNESSSSRSEAQGESEVVLQTATPEAGNVSNAASENSVKVEEANSTILKKNGIGNNSDASGNHVDDSAAPYELLPDASQPLDRRQKIDSRSCDLYIGKWFYDSAGPIYSNNTCPIITQMQNCQGNGRPDKEYENWRWKPDQCDLPRFDGRKFLELMRGKTLAFIGDSVARNQMESMLCMLWQVEAPLNRGSRRMQKWFFRSSSTNIVRIWSSWLVHTSNEAVDFAPEGIVKVHLDLADETFMEFLPRFDVVVLSSGHWFAKQSAYVLNKKVVGGQLWWPKEAGAMQINNIEAFAISVDTALTAIAAHPNFTGLAVLRSYSPDHYEGGAWNTGGSCTGKVKPASEVVRNGFTDVMHEKQVTGFKRALTKATGRTKLRLMDITEPFGFRLDGHPGPYRSPDPNKKTQRGPDGRPPPQDCLHWCMPGPIDTWNEILLEVIRRESEEQ